MDDADDTGATGETSLFFEVSTPLRAPEGGTHWPRTRGAPVIATIEVDRRVLHEHFGEPIADGDDVVPGIGRVELWGLRWPCGCEVLVSCNHPLDGNEPMGAEILTNDSDTAHALRTFESRLAADCARRTFEGRGHKQLYSVER